MSLSFKPLGRTANLIESAGFEVSLAYDDLIFVDNNAFLIQFTEQEERLNIHFNQDCPEPERQALSELLRQTALGQGMHLDFPGLYSLREQENDELELTFFS